MVGEAVEPEMADVPPRLYMAACQVDHNDASTPNLTGTTLPAPRNATHRVLPVKTVARVLSDCPSSSLSVAYGS